MRRTLAEIKVASPCAESWDAMRGDARTRFCECCQKHVHNLAAMTPREVEVLAMRTAAGDAVCGQVTVRANGSLITLLEGPGTAGKRAGKVLLTATLAAGLQAAAQDVMRTPSVPLAVVTGRLLRPDGSPVSSGLVFVRSERGAGPAYVVDEIGNFEIHAEPGMYNFVLQTSPEEAESMTKVNLHQGWQSFGDIQTRSGQHMLVEEQTFTTGGALVSTIGWNWKSRMRHPVLYVRSVIRRIS